MHNRKGGKRARKVARAEKRKRYKLSFERRYGIPYLAWPQWKKDHTPQEVHDLRLKAQ